MPADDSRRTDVATALGAFANRLRLSGFAIRGMATLDGEVTSREAQIEVAGELSDLADLLDKIRATLCSRCSMLEVVETTEVDVSPA